jgi:DNA-binding GntR family transcriptional regulator
MRPRGLVSQLTEQILQEPLRQVLTMQTREVRMVKAEQSAEDNLADGSSSRRGKLYGAAVANLRTMIVSGRLPPGELLREQELCRELGISRTPLREAIRTLAREGLVKLSPNRSAIVASLDVQAVENLYQTIGHIEALGAKLACQRASDEEINQIRILHYEMLIHYHKRDLPPYIQKNVAIHRALLMLAKNDVLMEIWTMLHPRVEQARTLGNMYPDRWDAAVLEHEAMLKALVARDGETLAGLMQAHYAHGLAALVAGRVVEPPADAAAAG